MTAPDALAALIAEVLRAHHDVRELHPGGVKTYHCEKCCGQSYCLSHTRGEFAAHQAAAVLAAITAEHAIVKLPTAEPGDGDDEILFYAAANANHVRLIRLKDIQVDGNWYLPDEARDVAAALLAAVRAGDAP